MGFEKPPEYPARVVLNNRTITIFTGTDFNSVYKSFDLSHTKLDHSKFGADRCFDIVDSRDSSKRVSLCIMDNLDNDMSF